MILLRIFQYLISSIKTFFFPFRLLHMNRSNDNLNDEDIMEHEMNQKNNFVDYGNGNGVNEEVNRLTIKI